MNVFQTGGKYDIRLNKPLENLKILTGYVCCETRAVPADNPIHFTFHRLPAMWSVHPFIGEQQLGDTVVPREQNSVTRPPHQSASRRAKRRHPTSTWRGKGVTSLNGDILFTVGQMRGWRWCFKVNQLKKQKKIETKQYICHWNWCSKSGILYW